MMEKHIKLCLLMVSLITLIGENKVQWHQWRSKMVAVDAGRFQQLEVSNHYISWWLVSLSIYQLSKSLIAAESMSMAALVVIQLQLSIVLENSVELWLRRIIHMWPNKTAANLLILIHCFRLKDSWMSLVTKLKWKQL